MAKSDFKFHTSLRVRWSECDAQGIAYMGSYMDYLEVAQAEYYRNLGFSLYHLADRGYFDTASVKATLEFKAPVRLDDMVEVYTRISRIGTTSIATDTEIYRQDSDLLLLQAQVINVGYDAKQEVSKRVPDDMRTLISHFEKTGEVLSIERFPNLKE